MRKPLVDLVIDEESLLIARERPEAKEALKRIVGHIAESFVESIPPDEWPEFHEYFKTTEGNELLVELWPQIVDAYFKAIGSPARRRQLS